MLKALYILDRNPYEWIYGPAERAEISRLVDVYAPAQTVQKIKDNPDVLHDVELIFSGWGAPTFDEAFLAAAPNLKAIFYGAGSIRGITTDAFWDRGLVITSAYGANAVPVSEYTLATILFSLKRGWQFAAALRRDHRYPVREDMQVAGAYGSTVGIISLGMVGRLVCERLRPFDLNVIAYDPFATPETASMLGVELCSLHDVFARSDVVSLHTPWLPETEGMIASEHFEAMKPGATFINTARGAVVREMEMISVLQKREDIFAVLDVTHPEPPPSESPLYVMPNVLLTPHIAGSVSAECRRQGRYMVEELQRYLHGEPLLFGITRERAKVLA
jgi:phosphoglycerate dehydrogenase-like enzyme